MDQILVWWPLALSVIMGAVGYGKLLMAVNAQEVRLKDVESKQIPAIQEKVTEAVLAAMTQREDIIDRLARIETQLDVLVRGR